MKLPLHSAFHTPVMRPTSETAQQDLAGLSFSPPTVPLFSGHGDVFRPRWASPDALRAYTLGPQVYEPYDFTTSVRTALRHTGADVVIALGPGNALGGPLAAILVNEGWHGLQSRADFDAMQASDEPVLLSFGMPEQRARLT
jgi:acyl transferase domain-containing protein